MDPKPQKKKMKLTLKRETVRTLDDSALNLLDAVAGGTRPSNGDCAPDEATYYCNSEYDCW
jgi:hypothetical protein